jgi:o-succinylbenzoate synthase
MQFEFRRYSRRFHQPLRTSHGLWTAREGIIVRLEGETGQVGFGEIAPIEWFGTETIEDAIELCQQLPSNIDFEVIAQIPDAFPACQFGFESAWLAADLETDEADITDDCLACSALLSSENALDQGWKTLWDQGYRTFKLKIGVKPIQTEITTLKTLLEEIPGEVMLRLDANGGLNEPEAHFWLEVCENVNSLTPRVEFLEQPLPPEQFETMQQLSQEYSTPIALDESVATITQLTECDVQGWQGIFVIKPAIAGSPSRLRQFCQAHPIDTVFSSVFETAIARQAGLKLAANLSNRAAGYGTTHWFNNLNTNKFDEIWNTL